MNPHMEEITVSMTPAVAVEAMHHLFGTCILPLRIAALLPAVSPRHRRLGTLRTRRTYPSTVTRRRIPL